ncbi:MAG: FHA domain-containing protein [Thermomicrobiales bacterium]|nr:FHA domain-containing protein [Thermomicrobiales bacterium]
MKRFRPFNRLEETLERAIEGSVDRVFKPSIQPSEIARKLSREMSERQMASVRGAIVPNAFVVSMHPDDFASFAGNEEAIAGHLESWLDDEADRLGFVTAGRVEVELAASETVRPRSISIASSMKETRIAAPQPGQAVGQTEAFWVQPPRQSAPSFVIEVIAGPLTGLAHYIHKAETSVGRSLDNDWVIDGANVSRHHAVIELNGSQLRIADLRSTNGTFVNGRQILGWTAVYPGDLITFGVVETRIGHDLR